MLMQPQALSIKSHIRLLDLRAKLQKRLLLIGENYASKSKHEQNEVDIKRIETEIYIIELTKIINNEKSKNNR